MNLGHELSSPSLIWFNRCFDCILSDEVHVATRDPYGSNGCGGLVSLGFGSDIGMRVRIFCSEQSVSS